MLDYFAIFDLGGRVRWQYQWRPLSGSPLNALIDHVLIDQKATASKEFAVGTYKMKWVQDNKAELVYVAVYRSVLTLPYVDDLLAMARNRFEYVYRADRFDYGEEFTPAFQTILAEAEAASVGRKDGGGAAADDAPESSSEEDVVVVEKPADDVDDAAQALCDMQVGSAEASDQGGGAFNTSKLRSLMRKKGGRAAKDKAPDKSADAASKRAARPKWGATTPEDAAALDFTDKSEAGAPRKVERVKGKSLMDEDDDASASVQAGGWLNSVMKKMNVSGQELEAGDILPILDTLKEKLIAKNVAEEVAQKICDSVQSNMVGKKLASFTRVSTAVTAAVEEALTNILSPGRNINVLQEIEAAKREGEPYSIVFIGVNGVGKSTNLAKVAFWLMQHGHTVLIAACDTFRSGAVEQLKTHTQRLGVELFERGYEKDPAAVAREAIKKARGSGVDVVLVDTAGRMQDNEPLMRALAKLINMNNPNLTLFVGEALVGNEAVDQLDKFNQRIMELSTSDPPHRIDGIVLTKFDTIDNKVGAALSMVYISGAPVIFVGCGQTYSDLRRLNVKQIVSVLLE